MTDFWSDWFAPEAVHSSQQDADLMMGELEAQAAAAERSREAGLCPHQSWRAVSRGSVVRTDRCGRVFLSSDDLLAEAEERCS